ncbi:MAG: DUF447 family protein [Methanosarcinaceae archaeon]|nr:DUF447 family protein [Methanosarcinaceae archaeon]
MIESEKPELDDFGIFSGISETIVTTTQDSLPNAAPIGIIRKDNKVLVRLFKGSQTYDNVFKGNFLVANVVNDPLVFVRSTFSDLDHSEFDVVSARGWEFPVLKDALSWVAFECSSTKLTSEALVAELDPIFAHLNRCVISAPNRGFNAVLEATVHATRYRLTGDDEYLKLIQMYARLAVKCGEERDKLAMEMLYDLLEL